jgi:hypothetical protein
MSWRNNWLLALPPIARLLPPLVLAVFGATLLVWLHGEAPRGWGPNLSPLVWCALGGGLLVRPAQPLVVSAAAFGMAGLAATGALDTAFPLETDQAGRDLTRVALWGLIALVALPAAIGEALAVRRVLARRLYFAAVMLFFLEQALRHETGRVGQPSEAILFLLVALVALFGVLVADRTLADRPDYEEAGKAEMEAGIAPIPRVRYLEEPPPISCAEN